VRIKRWPRSVNDHRAPIGPSGYWFNQLLAFGAVGKWSTKARVALWKKIRTALGLTVSPLVSRHPGWFHKQLISRQIPVGCKLTRSVK
jgi:hypothetical protein